MSEKWFVVSESELLELKQTATLYGYEYDKSDKDMEDALAACRARPFEKYQAVVKAAKKVVDPYWHLAPKEYFDELRGSVTALEEDV